MVVPRSLFQLLVEALQDSRPGMVPDDPAEIAGRYPQSGGSNRSNAEAQTRFPPPVDVPQRDPNFRQLSRAPFAAQAQTPVGSNVQPNSPDYLWNAPLQHAGSVGAYGDGPTLPRWSPPMLPVPGGRIVLPRTSGLGGPMPPPSTTSPPSIPMPPMPEAWRVFGPLLMLHPELLRERLFGERGESRDGHTNANQSSASVSASKSAAESPQAYPRVAPAFGEGDRDCKEEIREAREICTDADAAGWKGEYGTGPYKNPRGKPWDIEDCVRGRVSERCGGNRYDRPDGKPKKRRYLK